ncbi:MAG TPA: Ppx/GppA family phosphatase [Rhizomicrobium sp.]|jgi:exopolyphosphatase/guanosine-5'-triphosphate,3'-diphosphate pyrophosphatase
MTAMAETRVPGALRSAHGPVAIVDIGSNSVRLVIYESFSRIPAVVHNEKAICAIGRGMVSTGRLDDTGIKSAIEALARFRMLADAHGVTAREAVATAAARDADNGREFIREAQSAWGGPIRVLSGEEEAHLAAEGVLSGTPTADGLAADLGGGSLDMVTVKSGRTGAAMTLPYGPLRLMDQSRDDPDKARKLVDKGLEGLTRLGDLKGRSLYAVGGVWRSFARIDMENRNYPLHVLHDYTISRGRVLDLCDLLSRQSRKSLDLMKVVSRRRAEALPYGAVVLERLMLASGVKDLVVSAYGLREGLLHDQLPEAEREKDPLIEFAAGTNIRISRAPEHANEMVRWMEGLFPGETAEEARIRRAICLFSDMGWRRHPDDRALGAFNQVLTAPFAGAEHRVRALIATAIFHRYSGDEDFPREIAAHDLLTEADDLYARRIGLAARLAFALSASSTDQLPHYKLRMTPTRMLLEISRRREAIAGEPVQKRLGALASAFDRKGEILIG